MRMLHARPLTSRLVLLEESKSDNGFLVAAYLNRLSPGSRRAMRQGLERAAQTWLGNQDATAESAPWQRLTVIELNQVRAKLAKELAPASVNKILSAVRGVVREAQRQQAMPDDVAQALIAVPWLPLDDADAAPLRTLSRQEVQRLFDACAQNDTPAARRDAAVLAMFLSCGLRRAELVGLNIPHFQCAQRLLTIEPENREKSRVTELHQPAAQAVQDWLSIRGAGTGPLFPPVNKAGRVGTRRMTPQAVYDLIRRLGRRANVDDLTSRRLRRTCVVALIASGQPLEQIQQRLGNASWMSNATYASLASETDLAIDLNQLPYRPLYEPAEPSAAKETDRHS